MGKTRKTYGIGGMMECQVVIRVGKAHMRVNFSGGSFTAFGMKPAEFSTTNPVVQRAIEESGPYKSGKIRLLRTYRSEGAEPAAFEPAKSMKQIDVADNPEVSLVSAESSSKDETPDEISEEETERKNEIVAVTCLDEARDYLEEVYGIERSKLRKTEQIKSIASDHGIVFEGI